MQIHEYMIHENFKNFKNFKTLFCRVWIKAEETRVVRERSLTTNKHIMLAYSSSLVKLLWANEHYYTCWVSFGLTDVDELWRRDRELLISLLNSYETYQMASSTSKFQRQLSRQFVQLCVELIKNATPILSHIGLISNGDAIFCFRGGACCSCWQQRRRHEYQAEWVLLRPINSFATSRMNSLKVH